MSATVIAAHTRIDGALSAQGDLVIEGAVAGDVRTTGQLTLGAEAQVSGEIQARDVRIAGRLTHSVRAEGVIHLLASAEVCGDLEAGRVIIDDGALFEGRVKVRRPAAAPQPLSPPPAVVPRSLPPAAVAPTRPSLASAPIVTRPTAPAFHRAVPELPAPGRRRIQRRGPA